MNLTSAATSTPRVPDLAFDQYLTIRGVRDFLVADAELPALGLTQTWTDEEIRQCIVAAARKYNSIPPLVHNVQPQSLPANVDTFFDGAAAHAYQILMSKLQREDVDSVSGGVSTNMVAKQINHCTMMADKHGKAFAESARIKKMTINVASCYGRIG